MEYEIFRSIKLVHPKWNKVQCMKFIEKHLNLCIHNLKEGLPDNQYIVLPGFESVTRFQPIIIYNSKDSIFEVITTTKFFKPSKLLKD